MRGATSAFDFDWGLRDISIHAPHAGRDKQYGIIISERRIFQSTRPMRGATIEQYQYLMSRKFQSTRPMRGATR